MSPNHNRLFVESYHDNDPATAIRTIAAAYGLGVLVEDRTTLENHLARPLTDNEWDGVHDRLPGFAEWVGTSSAYESLLVWRDHVLNAIPHECSECGQPMFTTSTGVTHHVANRLTPGERVEGIDVDHDADADHVAYDPAHQDTQPPGEASGRTYSRVTNSGTAMAEATLCGTHLDNPADRAWADNIANNTDDAAPQDTSWHDSTDNDATACIVCGTRAPLDTPGDIDV